jgi:hypothetical protein
MLDVRDGPSTALRVFRMLQGDVWALVIAGTSECQGAMLTGREGPLATPFIET